MSKKSRKARRRHKSKKTMTEVGRRHNKKDQERISTAIRSMLGALPREQKQAMADEINKELGVDAVKVKEGDEG